MVSDKVFSILNKKVKSGSFCDPFGGMSTIGALFKENGYQVYSGDILKFANCFQISRIEINHKIQFRKLKKEINVKTNSDLELYMNNIPDKKKWFTNEYAVKRKFFTLKNAKRIEACVNEIYKWKAAQLLNRKEYAYLISSLIDSMDKIANTAGTYYAYLKEFNRKSLKNFKFQFIKTTRGAPGSKAYLQNANTLIKKKYYDIIYLDPPYNERCYASYYHLPETLATGKFLQTHGKAGLTIYKKKKSDFNNKGAFNKLEELLGEAKFQLLAFHYTDNGLISRNDIRNLLKQYGKVEEKIITSMGYSTNGKCIISNRLYLVSNE